MWAEIKEGKEKVVSVLVRSFGVKWRLIETKEKFFKPTGEKTSEIKQEGSIWCRTKRDKELFFKRAVRGVFSGEPGLEKPGVREEGGKRKNHDRRIEKCEASYGQDREGKRWGFQR